MQTRHSVPREISALILAAAILAGTAVSARAGLLGIGDSFTLDDIDPATAVASNPRDVGNRINMIAYAPDGTLYGAARGTPGDAEPGGMLHTIHPMTGAPTYRATLDVFITIEGDIACDPTTGILYAVDSPGRLFTINTSTGACTVIGQIATSVDLSAMAFDPAGNLHEVESLSRTLYEVNKRTATTLETHSMGPIEQRVGGLAYLPVNATMIFTGGVPFCQFYNVNCSTGAATLIAPVSGAGFMYALTCPSNPTPVGSTTGGRIKAMHR